MFAKPILNYTGAELKAHLFDFIRDGLITYLEAVKHIGTMKSIYFADIRCPGVPTIVDGMLSGWAEELVAAASRQNNDGTNASITLHLPQDEINYTFKIGNTGLYNAWCDLGDNRALDDYMTLLDRTLEQTDFDAMARSIERQAESLADLGLKAAARDIAKFANLTSKYSGAKLKANGLEFELFGGGSTEGQSRYQLMRELNDAIPSLAIAERETGIDGLEDGMFQVLRDFNGYGTVEVIPSRTKFGSGPVTATVYKDKTRINLSADVADALLSFIALHGDIEISALDQAA